MLGYSIDLSHYQNPNNLPWDSLYKGAVDLVIARATYGAEYIDPTAAAHLEHARRIGAKVGCYHFFRPSQPWEDQARAFERAVVSAGLGVGDVVPALDIEADTVPTHTEVTPAWEPSVRELVDALRFSFGECLVYITRRDWQLLGSPAWVLDRPLWVAHYTTAPTPLVPGNNVQIEPVMWQHRVGPFVRDGFGGELPGISGNPQVDQSRILAPVPLIGGGTWTPGTPSVAPSV